MASNKQLEANRNNAKLGGVKTPEGKAVSRYNARKHAILSQSLTTYDEQEEYEAFVDELIETYGKSTGIVGRLIEQAATCYIQLRRANQAETEYLKATLNPRKTRLEGGLELYPMGEIVVVNEGYTPKVTYENVETLMTIYCRYQTTLENRLFRLLQLLDNYKLTSVQEGN